jgi:hypothetical protein
VGCAAIAGILDWQIHLPGLVRALGLVGILTGAGLIWYRHLLVPLKSKTDDLSLALSVENEYPVLNDALASTIQFLQKPTDPKTSGSPVLRREAVTRAMRLAQSCDFNKVVDSRGVRLAGVGAAALLAGAIAVFAWYPAWAWTALVRLGDPFGEHAWPTQTQLVLTFPDRVAVGQPFVIRGDLSGVIPDLATIELDGMLTSREVFKVGLDAGGKAGKLNARLDMARQDRDFRFRVRANDAVDPPRPGAWHHVKVSQPPRLAALDGLPSPQVSLIYPLYTDKAPDKLSPGVGRIEAVAGTVATIRGAADRPIRRVWIEHRPDPVLPAGSNPLAALANGERDSEPAAPRTLAVAFLGPLGWRHPVETLALTAGGHAVWGRTPGRLAPDGRKFTIEFMPWISGAYVLHLEDNDGLVKDYDYDLQGLHPQGLADPVPVVNLERPASSQSVVANADIPIQALADDEFFAVRSVYLAYRRKNKDGAWLEDRPQRVPLYDGPAAEQNVSQLLAAVVGSPVNVPLPALHLRPKQVQVARRWSLAGLVKDGDLLVLQACAHDFNDVAAFNLPGCSHEVELRVVSRPAIQAVLDEAQAQIQQELIRLREWQEQALKKVIEAEQEWRATGKLQPETVDKLLEAEQVQKQVHGRVGAKEDEGLRAELDRLKQMMRDNKMPPSSTQDRIQTLKSELDRLARDRLPQAEQRLAEASKEHKDAADAKVPSPKIKGNLGKAREDQQEVQQTLEELLKYLESWATRNEIKGETRTIQQEQQELQKETEKLAEMYNKLTREGRRGDDQFKGELKKNAELQRRLGERAQRLLDKMDRVSEDRLDELAKLLESGAKTEKAKQEARDLIAKRRALKDQAERLENKFAPTASDKAALRKNAEVQRQLGEQLKNLASKADAAGQDRIEKDLATAEMLEKAASIGKKEMLPGEMKDAGNQLAHPDQPDQEPQFNRAAAQQRQTLNNLDKMLDAMEERREAEVERLTKKQRNAQKDMDALLDRQERLQKKARDAMKNPNPDARKEALEKLAKEQRELEDEVNKKGRELARLQAGQAGKSMDKAAQKMGKAARQLDQGENPEEAQQDAMEKLEQAQEELQDAENQAEEELAREQLAKIADQIKGLKDRQDAAIEESARIHKLVRQNMRWTRALLPTLAGHAQAQSAIAADTKSLKDKLKGAAAFELVLDRAARSMQEAARLMTERHKKAAMNGLNIAPFEKEELAAEDRADTETRQRQREASRRLEHLMEALKPDDGVAQRKPKQQDNQQAGDKQGGDKQGAASARGDGIPPVAQLKALRAEQQEVNDRTKQFAEQHPDPERLDQAQRIELQSIREDQEQVFELFQRLMAAANGEGGKQ